VNYAVKEIFLSLQGEGVHAGRVAVFCRFAGCNLWSGREQDRAGAACAFCDTDFVGTDGPGGGVFCGATALAAAVLARRPSSPGGSGEAGARPFVVLTGGEPLLQADPPLLEALHAEGFEVALETNGTLPVPPGFDWVCVSPKPGAALAQREGDELKLVYPQPGLDPASFERLAFRHFSLQPLEGGSAGNELAAVEYCLVHPKWRLSLQMHKRSEERRVGKECRRLCRSRWSPYH
jgi:7-carboxy-7-deazaguanine synthase (Cx14CxxC type)